MSDERTEPPSGEFAEASLERSGWVTTKVAAASLGVTPRTIRTYVYEGDLEDKTEQEGVNKRLLVSIESLDTLRVRRGNEGKFRTKNRTSSERGESPAEPGGDIAEVIRDLSTRLEQRAAEAADMRARLELTSEAETTLRERVEKLEAELEAERSKGFWQRLFGR